MKGTQRVQRVINKFVNLVDELDKGAVEIDEEMARNTSVIGSLQAKNIELGTVEATARSVARNLRKIIGSQTKRNIGNSG